MEIPPGHIPPPYENEEEAKSRLWEMWKLFAASQNYPAGTDSYVTDVYKAIVRRFFPEPGEELLFLGCGDGGEVEAAESLGHWAYGVTLNPNNVKFAREVLCLDHVYYMDGHFLPLNWANKFDGVFGFQYAEHMPSPVLMLVEVLRVLRKGGLGFFRTPGPRGYTLGANLHHHTAPIDVQAEGWMLKSGFVNVRVETLGPEDSAAHLDWWGYKP